MFKVDDFLELNSNFITNCKAFYKIFLLFTIPALIFSLSIAAHFSYLPFKIELHIAVLLSILFFVYTLFIPYSSYILSCKFKTKFEEFKEQLLIHLNKNLLTIDKITKSNSNIDEFIEDYFAKTRNSNLFSTIGMIFTSLGILGTFISIIVVFIELKPLTVVEVDINEILQGVISSFYILIYGVFLTIWWIFFEKLGDFSFEKDRIIIKNSTKTLFWTKIEIESLYVKSNIDNFIKMEDIFKELTSSKVMKTLNKSIEQRFESLENLLEKEEILSEKLDANITNFERLLSSAESMNYKIKNQNDIFMDMSKDLNKNIVELNSHMDNLSSENLKAIYTNIVKSIETMKGDIDKIEWKYKEGLKESLRQIDEQTSSIVKNLSIFKDLSK